MPCSITCLIATALIISMIYYQNATNKSQIVQQYKAQLPPNLKNLYDKISEERLHIYYFGYVLGFILSIIIILYNVSIKNRNKLTNTSLCCLVIIVSFFTNYFYYILSPKSDWMLNHINSPEQTKAWLYIYRTMQVNYHMGFVIGIAAIGLIAFAFRC
jgi:uncharacterized membrane protein YkgB